MGAASCSAVPAVGTLPPALAARRRRRQGVSHCARKPLPALIPLRLPPKAARNRAYPRPAGKNARFMITAIRAMFSSTIGKFLALAFVALVGVAFALSDVTGNSTFGGVGGANVAKVGSENIGVGDLRERVRQTYDQARQDQPGLTRRSE